MNSKVNNITTLDGLVAALSSSKRKEFNRIIRSSDLPLSAFQDYTSWSNEGYTRNCIFHNDDFELILICWGVGQGTAIHDHGGEECWVKVIEGELKETIFKVDKDELEIVKTISSKRNEVTYMVDFMGFHRLENQSDNKSMSLHLYAEPIHHCNMFDQHSKKFVNKDLDYDTTK